MLLRPALASGLRLRFFSHLLVCGLYAVTPALAAVVQLHDKGDRLVVANEDIALTLLKEKENVVSAVFRGREVLGNGGVAQLQYYGKGSGADKSLGLRVHHRTDEVIDLMYVSLRRGFEVEMHYVVRAGDPGFYNYIVIRHDPKNFPAPGDRILEQVNLLVRADPKIFNYATIGKEKEGPLPPPEYLRPDKMVMDASYRLPDGTVDAKYDWSVQETDERVFGLMGDGIGVFIVKDSGEALNGAPVGRELSIHQTTTTPVLLRHFTAAHYGRGDIRLGDADGLWGKLAGPWFVFLAEGPTRDSLWAQAKAREAMAARDWPYTWMNHPLYPLERGTVKGQLHYADGRPAAGATVLVGPPATADAPNWRRSGKGYFFWARADAEGRFEINDVRPGTYDLWAVSDETFGDFHQAAVSVTANNTTDAGRLTWTPAGHGRTVVWQIGVPDETAGEYRNGQDYRQWGQWLKYPKEFPADVNFKIGKSAERRDWNYLQPAVQTEEGNWRLPTWRIRWDQTKPATGRLYLRVAVAGVSAHANEEGGGERWAGFAVGVNGRSLDEQRFGNDSGATRSAVRGNYSEVVIPFDADALRPGENEITLTLISTGAAGIRHHFPYCSVLYDALRLEMDAAPAPGGPKP